MEHRVPPILVPALVLAFVVAAAVAGSVSWTDVVGHPLGDVSDHMQGMWWFGSEILSGRFPLESQVTHGPGPTPLWFIDPLGGILSLPFRHLGPAGAYNAAVMVQLWLSGVALWVMVRDLTGRTTGALIGGVIVVGSPFLLGVIHSGLSEYVGLTPVVLYLWALIRITGRDPRNRPPPRLGWLWATGALTLVALQSVVLFLCAAVLTACFIPGCGWRDRLRRLLPVVFLACLPVWGLSGLISSTLEGPVGLGATPGWAKDGLPGVDLLGFFWPFGPNFPDTEALGNPGVVHVHFLGWIALGLAGVGWRHLRNLRMAAALYFLLCLGPVLVLAGQEIPSTEAALRLPLAMLYWEGSPFRWVHHPYRMTAFLLPMLALFAAVGAARLSPAARTVFGAFLVIDTVLLSPVRLPLPSTDVAPPAAYSALPPGPVLEWPPDATDWNRRYVRWQASHGHPIAYGVNVRMPDAVRQDPFLWNLFLKMDDPAGRLWNRDEVPRQSPKPLRPLQSIQAQGFTSLVLHLPALSDGEQARAIAQMRDKLGAPVSISADALVWDLRP